MDDFGGMILDRGRFHECIPADNTLNMDEENT